MRDDWKLAATSQNSFAWKTLNLFFYLKSAVRVLLLLLLAHSQRIRRNYAHTRQRHIHIDTAAWRPLHLPFMHDHVNNFASRSSRLPLLTFPVAFFLVAAASRVDEVEARRREPLGAFKKHFQFDFLPIAPRAFSRFLFLPYVWRICVRADSTLLIRPVVCVRSCFLVVPSAPKSNEYFEKKKKNSIAPSTKFTFRFCIFCG